MTANRLFALAVAFAMTGICTALALEAGSNALTVVTVRTAAVMVLLTGWLLYQKIPMRLQPRDRMAALAIGVPMCLANYLINAAIAEMPVPLVVLTFYTWPAMATAASWILGKEQFHWRAAGALVLAFGGVSIALKAEFGAANATGIWLALSAALMWSLTFVLTGHFFRGRDTRAPTLHMLATALVLLLAACLWTGEVAWPANAVGWGSLVAVGGIYAFALIGLSLANVRIGARAAFYMNFEPIASVLLAAVILAQHLAPVQLVGGALVIAALFLFRPPAAASPSRKS